MLLVRTRIGPSAIAGIGLFADEDIAKDTPIWVFAPGFDLEIDEAALSQLSGSAKDQFLNYTYLSQTTGKYILCFDDSRFMNHADQPNTRSSYPPGAVAEEGFCYADRDIKKGEEITCNYHEFDNQERGI